MIFAGVSFGCREMADFGGQDMQDYLAKRKNSMEQNSEQIPYCRSISVFFMYVAAYPNLRYGRQN
jgi:hypothetical protein